MQDIYQNIANEFPELTNKFSSWNNSTSQESIEIDLLNLGINSIDAKSIAVHFRIHSSLNEWTKHYDINALKSIRDMLSIHHQESQNFTIPIQLYIKNVYHTIQKIIDTKQDYDVSQSELSKIVDEFKSAIVIDLNNEKFNGLLSEIIASPEKVISSFKLIVDEIFNLIKKTFHNIDKSFDTLITTKYTEVFNTQNSYGSTDNIDPIEIFAVELSKISYMSDFLALLDTYRAFSTKLRFSLAARYYSKDLQFIDNDEDTKAEKYGKYFEHELLYNTENQRIFGNLVLTLSQYLNANSSDTFPIIKLIKYSREILQELKRSIKSYREWEGKTIHFNPISCDLYYYLDTLDKEMSIRFERFYKSISSIYFEAQGIEPEEAEHFSTILLQALTKLWDYTWELSFNGLYIEDEFIKNLAENGYSKYQYIINLLDNIIVKVMKIAKIYNYNNDQDMDSLISNFYELMMPLKANLSNTVAYGKLFFLTNQKGYIPQYDLTAVVSSTENNLARLLNSMPHINKILIKEGASKLDSNYRIIYNLLKISSDDAIDYLTGINTYYPELYTSLINSLDASILISSLSDSPYFFAENWFEKIINYKNHFGRHFRSFTDNNLDNMWKFDDPIDKLINFVSLVIKEQGNNSNEITLLQAFAKMGKIHKSYNQFIAELEAIAKNNLFEN